MKRIILLEEKGDVYYVVQSPIKFLGITLFWRTDCCEIPAGGGSLIYKAIFKTLEEAKEYIKEQYKERISKIK
jgi:hypothetical protein